MGKAIEAIESQLGPLDSSKISTLSFLFSLPHLHDQINSALNTQLAANPKLTDNMEDILDIVKPLQGRSTPIDNEGSIHLSKINVSWAKPRTSQPYDAPNHNPRPYRPLQSPSQVTPHIFQIGGMEKEVANPAKSLLLLRGSWPLVPALEYDEALLDSGATHSVVGDASLFTALWNTNITLLVASSHQFPVDYIGKITLKTQEGTLTIRNVLLCDTIKRVVLSIGQIISQGLIVSLLNNIMNVEQNNTLFHIARVNFGWFIPFFHPSSPVAINCISNSTPPPPINLSTCPTHHIAHNMRELWHLSIRNIKRIMKFKATDGIPPFDADNIKIFHPCSVAKAEHCPLISASQKHIKKPGDVIATDLIGPLPIRNDGKRYALVIQDIFSRLTAVIALTDKSEAKYQLRKWMIKFMNITKFAIQAVRTDNGAEFCNHFFNNYLKEEGIIHELHAAWIFNCNLHSNSKITPYQIVGSKKPSLVQLRVFGIKAFIFNHQAKKDLGEKTVIGYNLGIMEDSKAALPMTYDEAMSSLQAKEWKKAIVEELNSMTEQQVFVAFNISKELKETPRDSILSTKWVFVKKGSLERFKGWLVARGFRQIHGINFEETFSPTPTFGALQLLFSIACKKKWKVCTFDVKVAFLHSLIDKPVYIWPPKGMNQPKNTVLKLKKALYGTKQAA
ncbi:hypothetical protein O181_066102 [Austropuccinia psidii MF-1]|uniref:Gag-Pol-p199 n=1 Tax=Austropuccinia psidii MF-1 TaxID=1389203 RepID=A0A9Q3EUS1_9BASI|nr:hypothetical protein [Austropuccinia psidii MF-1]